MIELVITMGPDKKKRPDGETETLVKINGPLANTVLCLGLLEMGKTLVMDYKKKKEGEIMAKKAGGKKTKAKPSKAC